jgi:predicted NAD/FAD-binding protein
VERIHPYERSVAVIGSGVAGLVAAYALSARNRVTLFEADTRIGGHAHTHYVDRGDGYTVGVDSAFLVHNDRTYPTLCRLFAELGIATRETDMSMSVRDDGSGLEYAGARGIGGLFPSWSVLTGRDTCGCWPRSSASTRRRPGCCRPTPTKRSASSWNGTASPATSSTIS